jgi:hypothetical protein
MVDTLGGPDCLERCGVSQHHWHVGEELGVAAEWTMEAAAEDYRNTLALEARMAADPAERERWIQEQLGIEFEATAETNGEAEVEDEVVV